MNIYFQILFQKEQDVGNNDKQMEGFRAVKHNDIPWGLMLLVLALVQVFLFGLLTFSI